MRLKTFHAKTMPEVMANVRNTMGPDAIIVQMEEGEAGVRVTAAIEATTTPPVPKNAPTPNQSPVSYEVSHPIPPAKEFDHADVAAVLNHHALPFETADHFTNTIASLHAVSLNEAFAQALETVVRFSPLTDTATRPIMLVGPPGVGKTVSTAKLTADALLHEKTVHIISTDTVKAGGVQQLDHFSQLMKQSVFTADTSEELAAVVRNRNERTDLTLIDTSGTNPFDMDELKSLLKFIQSVDAEPVLVMPAGLDPIDAQEIAGIFARMGCQRFIATRLDAARRYAGLIMAARPGYLALAGISRSPFISAGLEPATPMNFSRLLTALPKRKGLPEYKEQTS
jgi:flagellar biosynthesis protein FlhF